MEKLRNGILEKLASEGKISHMSEDEQQEIYKSTHERMIRYKQILSKREYYSYIIASSQILNS
jgi:hypothetical protein